ncbi:hypothetical protein [Nocardioides sp.]
MRTTGIVLLMLGLLFGLDVVNVGTSFLDEGRWRGSWPEADCCSSSAR